MRHEWLRPAKPDMFDPAGTARNALLSGASPMSRARLDRREIAVRVRTVTELFNSLDPSPFRERDLDPRAEEFVVGWARELPPRAPFAIVVELPFEQAGLHEAGRIGEAFANYFHYRAETAERDLRELLRVGRRSALIGLTVLVLCLVASHLALQWTDNAVAARIVGESLVIVGWVANWRPIEIYLYDWWPIRRHIRLYRRIAAAPVEIRPVS